jgi:hypothetical protein
LVEENERNTIEGIIRKRLDGIKQKNPKMIREIVDEEIYSKFDDWPPGTLLVGEDSFKNEENALKVLDEYNYSLEDFIWNIMGDYAIVTFYINYKGMIRRRSFGIKSRISMVLKKINSQWKIIHEHFSQFPENMPVSEPIPDVLQKEPVIEDTDLEEKILNVLSDGNARHIAEITEEISKSSDRKVEATQILDTCNILTTKGSIERLGRFYPRYRISK